MNKENIEAVYKLSPMQEGILFQYLMSPGTGSYLEQSAHPLNGTLDRDLFVQAWQETVSRHAVLRTSFVWEGLDQPLQIVHRQVNLPVFEHDWSSFEDQEKETRFRELFHKDRLENVDLTKPPLMRLHVIKVEEAIYQTIFSYHHLLMDGWSSNLVIREVGARYTHALQGRVYPEEPVRPYRDYLKWLDRQDMKKSEAFWRQRLSGIQGPTELMLARDSSQDQKQEFYGKVQHLMPEEETTRLQQLARANQLTFFTMVQAAWSLLLHRYSGQSTLLYGTTSSGRTLPITGIENMVGTFIHTLPTRVDILPKQTALTWMKSLLRESMKANQYEFTPLSLIRSWSEIPGHLPFFNHLLVYESFGADLSPNTGEDHVKTYDLDTTINFPLTLLVYPSKELILRLKFDTRHFSSQISRSLLIHLENLLLALCKGLEQNLNQLSMLSDDERERLLNEWNDTGESYPRKSDMFDLFVSRAQQDPTRIAAVFTNGGEIQYGELVDRAERLAHDLREQGVRSDEVVGICFERGEAMLVALLGVLASGAAYLPLDPGFPEDRLVYYLEDASARLVLTDERIAGVVQLPNQRVVPLDQQGMMLPSTGQRRSQQNLSQDRLAYTIYTSGSTGKPKGVMISQRALVNFLHTMITKLNFQEHDVLLAVTTISFDIAALELYLPLLTGGKLVLADQKVVRDGEALMEVIQHHEITMMQATPATWRLLQASGWEGKADLTVLCGGEALPGELAAWICPRNGGLWNLYGPTETTIWSGARQVTKPSDVDPIEPVGPPIGNTSIFVLDSSQRPNPVGLLGDVYIGGEGLARGYRNRPGLTASKFIPHPFSKLEGDRLYMTGDLGRFGPDGTISYAGRADHQIKLRGFRIELGEIDATMCQYEHLANGAAVLREGASGEFDLVGYVVPVEGHNLETKALRQFLRQTLPEYMVPSFFVILDEMPLNSSGKIDRKALVDHGGIPSVGKTHVAPRTDTERQLAEIWQKVLGRDSVGIHDNFFDLGGHSLRMVQIRGKINKVFQSSISMVELFEHTTIAALANFLSPEEAAEEMVPETSVRDHENVNMEASSPALDVVAVIGMSGRFPGAANVDAFWENIQNGICSITQFSDEELLEAGENEDWLAAPNYVKARGYLDDIEMFDAAFFAMTPREARVTDPQHRIFLEEAWRALEDAGYNPESYPDRIAVFGGAAVNTYAFFELMESPNDTRGMSWHQLMITNDQSFITTRVSYKLNLRGPSMGVQTACSTSLVALIQACQTLNSGEAEMAIAGGIAINSRQKSGYFHEEGGIMSADGICRPFESRANGTVFGSGVGLLVLKPLSRALADGDSVHALIRGYALNNDGAAKAGYTAPSIDGQARVIQAAQRMGKVNPHEIGYVETHGTGTPLGDPIELAALKRAFGTNDALAKGHCVIGSAKANVGHLDTAAGAAGLIKTVFMLQSGTIPPNPYFSEANPELELENSPFFINTDAQPWPMSAEKGPRRAGVSSFGIGGTNAHVILEQAPQQEASSEDASPAFLLPLSARTPESLEQIATNLFQHLVSFDGNMSDIAYTLKLGRKAFGTRAYVVCRGPANAQDALARPLSSVMPHVEDQKVIFMFTGQGAQYPGMGYKLYRYQPVFQESLDNCAHLLKPHLDLDIREIIYPGFPNFIETQDADATTLNQTSYTQPALFALEYALAQMWLSWGVQPKAMIGHSIGEYVAACLAGVFSLEDAAGLVAARGKAMEAAPPGAMLSVALGESRLKIMLGTELYLAAINGPARCVVSGLENKLTLLERRLTNDGVAHTRLDTSHAFHSPIMESAVPAFTEALQKVTFHEPKLPFVSNLTGALIRPESATDPKYWVRQMLQTVRFSAGLKSLLSEPGQILLELGPGENLARLARGQVNREARHTIASALPKQRGHEEFAFALDSLGRIWQAGAAIDWQGFYQRQRRRRLRLPTYPFQKQRFWVEKGKPKTTSQRLEADHWFYLPAWVPSIQHPSTDKPKSCLILNHRHAFGAHFANHLRASGWHVMEIFAGESFRQLGENHFELRPEILEDYQRLAGSLKDFHADHWLSLWNLGTEQPDAADATRAFYSPIYLIQSMGESLGERSMKFTFLVDHLFNLSGSDPIQPQKAGILGPARVIPREYPGIRTQILDLALPKEESLDTTLFTRIQAELDSQSDQPTTLHALRNGRRWSPHYQPVSLPEPNISPTLLKEQGTYLIIGGLGGMGLVLAEYLVRVFKARVILTTRGAVPERATWATLAEADDLDDKQQKKLRKLMELETMEGVVSPVQVDVLDRAAMESVLHDLLAPHERLDGVIHAAGIAGGGMIQLKQKVDMAQVLAPKIAGTQVLASIAEQYQPDFLLLCSSISAILGEFGQADYCAANAYMDAFAECVSLGKTRVISVNWGAWREVGMAVNTALPEALRQAREESLRHALSSAEGARAFHQVIDAGQPRIVVTPVSLKTLMAQTDAFTAQQLTQSAEPKEQTPKQTHARPNLASVFIAPGTEIEKKLGLIWQEQIGIERVGIDDNFFELGGDSLLGLQVVAQINQTFDTSITAASLYGAPTIRAVARLLEPEPEQATPTDMGRTRGSSRKAKIRKKRKVQSVR